VRGEMLGINARSIGLHPSGVSYIASGSGPFEPPVRTASRAHRAEPNPHEVSVFFRVKAGQ